MKKLTPIILLSLTAVLLYFAVTGTHGYFLLQQNRRQELALQKKSESLDKEIRELRRKIADIAKDPTELETRAREDVGLVKRGETVYIFPSRKTD